MPAGLSPADVSSLGGMDASSGLGAEDLLFTGDAFRPREVDLSCHSMVPMGGELNKRVKRSSLSVSDSLANEDGNVTLQSSLEISGGLSSSVSKCLGLCSVFDKSKVAMPPPVKRLCKSRESSTPPIGGAV